MNDLVAKIKEYVKNLVPLDKDAFKIYATYKSFCEEFLRVILKDDKIEVIDNEVQKHFPTYFFKENVVDLLCKLGDGRMVSVEIQLYNEKYHPKRILHYASNIIRMLCDKGAKYDTMNEVIMIYLTEKDIFKLGSTTYEVKMDIVSDQKEVVSSWDCGLNVFYVNTEGLTDKTINEYLQLLKDNETYSVKYKEISKIKEELVKNGGERMSTRFQEYFKDEIAESNKRSFDNGITQGISQGQTALLERLVKDGIITREEADKQLTFV